MCIENFFRSKMRVLYILYPIILRDLVKNMTLLDPERSAFAITLYSLQKKEVCALVVSMACRRAGREKTDYSIDCRVKNMKKALKTILYIVYEINCNFPTIVFYIFHNNLANTFRALMSELSRNILKLKHFLYLGFLLILHG